jgi:TP901-1 family phage major tail protein
MTKYKGKDFLLKVGDGGGPEVFTTVAGGRSITFSVNNEQVDVTDMDGAPWRELLDGAGVRSVEASLEGIFSSSATYDTIRTKVLAGTISNYRIYQGDGGYWSGAFQAVSLEEAAEYSDTQTYSLKLASSGTIVYTPPA